MATRKLESPRRVDWDALLDAARTARSHAYAPYSKCLVGAAVLTESGRVFAGCNVENASYGLTVCAERNAIGAAVAAGERKVLAVAVVASPKPWPPCGACRQVLVEFASRETPVVLAGPKTREIHQLGDLLPRAFEKSDL